MEEQGYVRTIVKMDISDRVKNVGEQSYSFDIEPNNVSRRCEKQEDGKWHLMEKTRRNRGTDLYMYGNDLRPIETVGKDLSYDGVRFDLTGSDGSLDVTLTVTAAGNNGLVQGIIVYGDIMAEQWATEAVLDDGKEIKSDNEIWAIRWEEPAKTHSVTFKKWRKGQYNACITHICPLPGTIEFDKKKLMHVDSLAQQTAQRGKCVYGAIWNTGSIFIHDSDGELMDYIRDGIIENKQMSIVIENEGRHGRAACQHHLSQEATYDKDTRVLRIELENKLEKWDRMPYAGRQLTEPCTAWELLVEVFATAGYTEDDVKAMCDTIMSVRHPKTGEEKEMTVETFFRRVTIPYPYLSESTFRQAIHKFCRLGMLYCYCDDDDNIKFVSSRPKLLKGEKEHAYEFPEDRIYGTTTMNIFGQRYRKVRVKVNKCTVDNSVEKSLSILVNREKEDEDGNPIEITYPAKQEDFDNVTPDNAGFVRGGIKTTGLLLDVERTYEYLVQQVVFDVKQNPFIAGKSLIDYSERTYLNDHRTGENLTPNLRSTSMQDKMKWTVMEDASILGDIYLFKGKKEAFVKYDSLKTFEDFYFAAPDNIKLASGTTVGVVANGRTVIIPILACSYWKSRLNGKDVRSAFLKDMKITFKPYAVSTETKIVTYSKNT